MFHNSNDVADIEGMDAISLPSTANSSMKILASHQSLVDEQTSITSISVPSSYRSRTKKKRRPSHGRSGPGRFSPNNASPNGRGGVDAQTTFSGCDGSRSASSRGGAGNGDASAITLDASTRSARSSTLIRRPTQFRNSSVEQELTVNKLRFSQDVLYGREEEQAKLQNCLSDSIKKRRKQIVFIRGESGVGKTALARSAFKNYLPSKGTKSIPLIVHGQFEENLKDEAYAGVAGACRHVCGEILRLQRGNQSNLFETVQRSLQRELERDPFLVRILPELEEIVNISSSLEHGTGETASRHRGNGDDRCNLYDIESMQQQLAVKDERHDEQHGIDHAFRVFFRVIGEHFLPVIMVLDNMHWADPSSLHLIQVLMTDRENSNLVLVGCCRTESTSIEANEEDAKKSMENARLKTVLILMEDWLGISNEFSFDVTDLLIGNLKVDDIHGMLMDLLSTDQSLMGLAKICHQKTHGHVFFVIEYLKSLHERGLLTYNLGMLKWVWDESRIVSQTMVADNVVDMMVEKMEALATRSAHILQLAALLGPQFDETTLEVVWRGINHDYLEMEDVWGEESSLDGTNYVSETLKTALRAGLLEALPKSDSTGYNKYRWTHDNIMEAAFSLIPEHQVGILMYHVGDTLASNLNPNDLERSIFVVANLLNEGKDSVGLGETMYYSTKRIRMAELNLLAAKRAVDISTFPSAVSYAQAGIELLPFDRWECHFDLTLELYSIAAETEAYVGDVEQMNRHCVEVVECPACSLWDRLRVFNVLVDSIAHQGNIGDASHLCMDLLKEVGCKFPQGRISVAFATAIAQRRTKTIVEKLTDQDIANLDELTDPRRIECMRLLDRLCTYSFYSDRRRFPLIVFRSLQWTLEHGVCYISPPIFAASAVILTGIREEFSLGSKLAEQALRLSERLESTISSARTIQITHSLVLNWTRPVRSLLGALFNGYSTGLKTGDTESAMFNIFYYLLLSFQSGKPLKAVEADCSLYSAQMIELKRLKIAFSAKVLWQTILNLIGDSENTTKLTGRELDYDVASNFAALDTNASAVAILEFFQLFIFTFFGDHQQGADLALRKGDKLRKLIPGSATIQMENLCRGVSLFATARRTHKNKYKREALKVLSRVKEHVKKGVLNVYHHEALLEAECAAMENDSERARHHYGRATVLAGRRGFLQDSALANERFGEYLLHDLSDMEEATYRFQQATRLYEEWGARAKADMLFEKYGYLWDEQDDATISA